MVFKTWLSDINKVALAMDGLQSITQFKTGSTIANGMELSTVAVNKYKASIEGLSLSQAKTALSTTALNEAQQNQILTSAGLLKTTESLTLVEVKEMASSMSLSAQKKEEILTTLQGAYSENEWNKERLEAIVLEGGEAGAIAEVILAKKAENVENLKNIASNKALTAVLKEQLIALASNPITWIVAGVAGTAVVLHNTSKAIDEVRQSASELNSEFNDSKSSVDGYKTQIDELYSVINNSSSSLEEVTTARQTLMSIQDELIDKFGDEKETIDLVTEAINGQSNALDILTQKKWQETKNKFNESDIWNDYANWQEGYSDNIDRMVNEMENAWGNIKMSTSDYFGGEYNDIIKRLEEAGWEYSSAYETFVKGGSVEDLYEEILDIQTLVGDDMPENFLNSLTKDANELKATLNSYEGMWDSYILNDKIFADENLADSWKEVNDAYTKYQNAVASGDKTAIEEATSGFATSINEVLNDENVSNSVKDYFKDMYPALYREVEKWEFKTNIIPEFDTSGLQGKTQADILKMLQTNGTQEGENVFNSILKSADEYGLVIGEDSEKIQQLLDLLVQWGILQGTITDTASQNPDEITVSNIFGLEDADGKLTTLGTLNEQVDNLQKAYTGLKSAMDSYNKSGYFTLDQVQEIVSYGDGYLQYLMDEKGNLQLNEEALNKLMVARINEMRVKALSDLYNQVSSIQDETDALAFLEGRLTDVTEATNEYNEAKFQSLLLSKRELMSDEAYSKFESSVIKMVNTTNALFDNIDVGSFSGKGLDDLAKAAKETLESTLAVHKAELDAGIIDYKTFLKKCNDLLNDARDKAIITGKEYWDYQKEVAENQLEVKLCLAS